MRSFCRSLAGLACLLSAACGGAPTPEPAPPLPPPPAAEPAPPPAVKSATGTLKRKDVVALVDNGFGRFMEMVQIERYPSVEEGNFRGWRVLGLRPPEFWQTVDLEPGDVVLSVNGKPIERDTQAFEAFESLRTAERITVVFERQGIERQLDFGIVDDPAAK